MENIEVRLYGNAGPPVVAIHGGPGAPGAMAPVARVLGESFRVLEPLQRRSGKTPLTVARHLADLQEAIQTQNDAQNYGAAPALVGHSWGAMLALAYAAAYPEAVRGLVLIGSGTFDKTARARLKFLLDQRFTPELRRRMEELPEKFPDADECMKERMNFLLPLYSYDLATTNAEFGRCDARGLDESWRDMVRLQESGVYPAAFAAIKAPVLMLHGAVDPHPGTVIRDSLLPYLPQLEYHEWRHCGHFPWMERAVRGEFFALLKEWLAGTATR